MSLQLSREVMILIRSVATGNAGFMEDLTKWVFQETGVIDVIASTHHRQSETSARDKYRIKDDLVSDHPLSCSQHKSHI